MHRDDDTPEAINHRLDLYEQQTAPLIEYYESSGRLAVVDGVGTPDDVFRLVLAARRRRRLAEAGVLADAGSPARALRRRAACDDARCRPGGRRDAPGDPRGDPPGRHHRHLDRIARDVLARRDATSNFLGYHGLPGR